MLRAAHAQFRLLAAPHDLQCLRDELDFADTAGPELDVVCVSAAAFLLANLPVDIAQSLVGIVVQIFSIDEGCDAARELVIVVTGDGARLEPRIAFPRTSLRDQVVLERDE